MSRRTSRARRRLAAPMGTLCILAACTLGDSSLGDPDVTLWQPSDSPGDRTLLATTWDTVASRPGSHQDTVLNYPHRIVAHAEGVYVYDDGARRLVSLDTTLSLRAVFGRKGGGPGEFEGVRDLTVTPSGDAALLDPANGRITVVSASGSLRRLVPVRDVSGPEQMVFSSDGNVVVYASKDRQRPLVLIDTAGQVLERRELPWTDFQRLASLSVNGRLSKPGSESGGWAFLFGYGNGWFGFGPAGTPPVTGRFIEHTPFPVPLRTADGIQLPPSPSSAVTAATRDSLLYVLFGGSGEDHLKHIDLYHLADGRYLGTYRLPARALSFSPSERGIYVLFPEPWPALYLLRPRLTAESPA